jgi:hypothetical protein
MDKGVLPSIITYACADTIVYSVTVYDIREHEWFQEQLSY